MSNTLKNRIIEILKRFDECYFCEDEGGLERKIEIYLLEILTELQKETKQAIEKVRLEKQDDKLENTALYKMAAWSYNVAVKDLEKKKKQVIKSYENS